MERSITSLTTRTWWAFAAIIIAVAFAHGRAVTADFVVLDDALYVTQNQHVQQGLTAESISWAFRLDHPDTYFHPLTWLSLMLDRTLLGPAPWGFHLVNVVLHAGAVALLFVMLLRTTGLLWPSLGAALLFGVHPLTVEAVAWIPERKAVLSTGLGLAAALAYARYAEKPSGRRMASVAALMLASLLAKPAIVILPFVLLVMDFWPLGRLRAGDGITKFGRLLLEKWPLAALSALCFSVALLSEHQLTIGPGASMSLRLENAIASIPRYLSAAAWPVRLYVFHPYPKHVPIPAVIGGAIVITCMSVLAVFAARRWPFVLAGWTWFLVALAPYLGLKQAGLWPAWADRFVYFPLMGIATAVSFGVHALSRKAARLAGMSVGIAIAALASASFAQCAHWADMLALFSRGAAMEPDSVFANWGLSNALVAKGRYEEAIPPIEAALRLNPASSEVHEKYAFLLQTRNRWNEAEFHYREALRLEPDNPRALFGLGRLLAMGGSVQGARSFFREFLERAPLHPDFEQARAVALRYLTLNGPDAK